MQRVSAQGIEQLQMLHGASDWHIFGAPPPKMFFTFAQGIVQPNSTIRVSWFCTDAGDLKPTMELGDGVFHHLNQKGGSEIPVGVEPFTAVFRLGTKSEWKFAITPAIPKPTITPYLHDNSM